MTPYLMVLGIALGVVLIVLLRDLLLMVWKEGFAAGRKAEMESLVNCAREADEAIELARESEAAALAYDKRVTNSEGASIGTHSGIKVYGNTLGFIGGFPSTYYSLSCVVVGSLECG